jgi:hypothetical protein
VTSSEPSGDERQLASYAEALVDAIDRQLAAWVERMVAARLGPLDQLEETTRQAAIEAGADARKELVPMLRALLVQDIDEQRETPLTILRRATSFPTGVLAEAGAPPVRRDQEAERLFPEDVYDLTPTSFADFGPDVGDAGIAWGAAKAHVHLTRRR